MTLTAAQLGPEAPEEGNISKIQTEAVGFRGDVKF